MRGRMSAGVVGLAVACVLAGYDDGPSDDVDPTPTGPSGLPALEEGRLVRVLGDGTNTPMSGMASASKTSVNGPKLLTTGPGGDLIGLQGNEPALFRLSADGTARTHVGEDHLTFSLPRPVDVLAQQDELLTLIVLDRTAVVAELGLQDEVSYSQVASFTGPDTQAFGGALLDLPDAVYAQWEGGWWRLTGEPGGQRQVERIDPPVRGAVASARSELGVSVLTGSELVHLDESLRVIERFPWAVPEGLESQMVTSAVPDGAGGLFITMAELTQDNGSVVHVTSDGANVLAAGFKPGHVEPSTSCEDADVEAQRADLSRPVSVAVWEDRLMIADEDCNSVLQLPLPDKT